MRIRPNRWHILAVVATTATALSFAQAHARRQAVKASDKAAEYAIEAPKKGDTIRAGDEVAFRVTTTNKTIDRIDVRIYNQAAATSTLAAGYVPEFKDGKWRTFGSIIAPAVEGETPQNGLVVAKLLRGEKIIASVANKVTLEPIAKKLAQGKRKPVKRAKDVDIVRDQPNRVMLDQPPDRPKMGAYPKTQPMGDRGISDNGGPADPYPWLDGNVFVEDGVVVPH